MTDKLAEEKIKHIKPAMYSYIFYDLRVIALKYGYNLVLHGSMNRDLDLIAVPWHEPLGDIETMIQEFATHLNGRYVSMSKEERECFPHGRLSYVINMNRGGAWNHGFDEQFYLDISVIPSPKAYHEAKLRESKIVEAFERENQYLTDEDIKDYALRIKRRESLCTVNYYATGFIEGAIAMRNGEIKHVSRDNE